MEREALAVQQGSFLFAICLLVLGLGINNPTWAQDEPVGPPAEQATEKKPKTARASRNSIATLDKVHLSDGSIQHGKVAELGGNTISLEYRGAAKRIPKALVDKIVFYEGRRSQQKLDIAPSISYRPLEHLSDEPLRLLVENAQQLKESSSVVVDKDGQVVTE